VVNSSKVKNENYSRITSESEMRIINLNKMIGEKSVIAEEMEKSNKLRQLKIEELNSLIKQIRSESETIENILFKRKKTYHSFY
jgi:hypothetical protein